MKPLSNKIKYVILGAIIVPCFGRLALHGTGHEQDYYRFIVPLFIGGLAGFLVGLMKDKWFALNADLVKSNKNLKETGDAHKQAEAALRESEENYRNLFNNNHSIMLLIDPENGNILDANPAATTYYGWKLEEITAKKITDINILTREQVFQEMQRAKTEQRRHFLFKHCLSNGDMRDVEVFSGPILYQGREILYSIIHDITDRKRVEEELKHLSFMDGLTGLANRRRFDEVLDLEWRRMTRNAMPLSLIMCDIDFFKAYNDTYGHQSGDDILIQVADTIKSVTKRPGDLVARYGGEEYAVILPETDSLGAENIAEEIRATVESLEINHSNSQICEVLTISMGVAATIPIRGSLPEELITASDHALYKAKKEGRNRVNLAT